MAVILTVGTNLILKVGPAMMVLSVVTIAAISLALSALALAFGTVFPQFETENMAQIPTSIGGLLFMMSSIALLAGVLIFESWPVLTVVRSQWQGTDITPDAMMVSVAGGLAALALCAAATVIPLRIALKRIEAFEA